MIGYSDYGIFYEIYIRLSVASYYGSVPLTVVLMVRDGSLSTLCHSCRFDSQQRVLEHFMALAICTVRMG